VSYVVGILFVIAAWWASTGAVLYAVSRSRWPLPVVMAVATGLATFAIVGLWLTSGLETVVAAFFAFACALTVWAWVEVSFLTGVLTGSRRTPCPANASGWHRFGLATQALIYHELAILALMLVVVAVTFDAPNQVGCWTFAILWLARVSAKLNVFLGVPNLTEEFIPIQISYVKSYFRNRPMNALLPVSITVSTVITVLLTLQAIDAGANTFEAASMTLLATLMALVVVEHWFLVLPLPSASLWSWGLDETSLADQTARSKGIAADPSFVSVQPSCSVTAIGASYAMRQGGQHAL